MGETEQDQARAVSGRLAQAMNAHDLEAQVACFCDDYRSEQPAHPARTFTGRDQVQRTWSELFESIPDFRAELLRIAVVGNEEWAEWIWHGTKEDGTPLEERGVSIFGIRDGRIAWAHLYLEEIEREGADITETVRQMAGREVSKLRGPTRRALERLRNEDHVRAGRHHRTRRRCHCQRSEPHPDGRRRC